MKKLIAVLMAVGSLISMVENAHALVRVRGYTRSNGTYVSSHFRTNPDGYSYNNFSNWE